jgi:hypothetical protein
MSTARPLRVCCQRVPGIGAAAGNERNGRGCSVFEYPEPYLEVGPAGCYFTKHWVELRVTLFLPKRGLLIVSSEGCAEDPGIKFLLTDAVELALGWSA